jgi:hypothetical protein
MTSGSCTSAEWLSTNPETIERLPGSGNLDYRGGQTVQDSRVGEYHDTPEETRKCNPEGDTGRYTGDRQSRHLGLF